MTKAISILIILVVLLVGWKLAVYYKTFTEEQAATEKVATGADIRPEDLPGLPQGLYTSLQYAQKNGSTGLRNWLKTFGGQVQDPRKAWIEMDCSLALLRDDPNEAKRIFQSVKERVSTNSPVYSRIRQLEKSFE